MEWLMLLSWAKCSSRLHLYSSWSATRAADSGSGLLYIYGNYSRDNMNFDMASETPRRMVCKQESSESGMT
jgi:dihydroxyacetone kinase